MNEHDLLTVKAFSDRTGIKQSTLRYYDDAKLFRPIERGKNGYRYYSAMQTIAVNLINVMSSLNMPLKTISEVQMNRTPARMMELFRKQEAKLNMELIRLQQAYSIIHTYYEIIREGQMADEFSIKALWMDETPIEMGLVNDFSNGVFYDSFFSFIKRMTKLRIHSAYPAGGYYNSMETFLTKPGKPTRYFCLVPTGRDVKSEGDYLVGYTRGFYGELGTLPQRLNNFAQEHGYTFTGPVYEMYLHDEICISEPDQYLIQASAAVQKQ